MPSRRAATAANARRASSAALVCWLALGLVASCAPEAPAPAPLALYDVVLAGLGVLVRLLWSSRGKADANLLSGLARSARGGFCVLHLVQAVHLHVCAGTELFAVRALSGLLTSAPWWMGGWRSLLGEREPPSRDDALQIVALHVLHLHGLYHGLHLTLVLTHFRETYASHEVVRERTFRWYWLALHAATSLDVLLQPLVDRRLLPGGWLRPALGAAAGLCALLALPVLALHVSEVGAILSFLLSYLRERRAASNLALAFVMTEVFELWTLLAGRYSLVFD